MRHNCLETPVRLPSTPFWVGLLGALLLGMFTSVPQFRELCDPRVPGILIRLLPMGLIIGLGAWAWIARRRQNLIHVALQECVRKATATLRTEYEVLERKLADQQKGEHDALAHEEWLRLILQHSSDGIDIAEKNLETHARRLVICNDRFVEMSGYSREELMACPDLNQLTVDTAPPEAWDYYRECVTHGRPYRGQSYWRRPDGRENYYEWTAAPFRLGDKYYVIGIDRDITERKRTEQALVAERNLLQTLVDTLPDNIFVKDLQGRFVFSNKACLRHQLMKSSEELMGKTDYDFVTREQAQEFWEQEQDIIRTGRPLLNQELIDLRDPEHPIYFLSSKVPWRDHEGGILGVIGVNRDITERKRAENALADERNLLRTLVDHLPETIFVKDRDSRFLFANASCMRHLRVDSLEQMIGKTDFDLIPLDRAQFHHAEEVEIIRTGQPILDQELCFQNGHGHTGWTLNTKVPWRDREGNIIGIVGLNHEITEHKLADERAKQHQEMMAHVARVSMAGEMAGGLAHELNQPLSAILNYAHGCVRRMRTDTWKTNEIITAIEQIIVQAERAGEIIRWLRNFVSRRKTRQSVMNLNQAIREALTLVEHETRSLSIHLRLHIAHEPLMVHGDLIQIEQVILNLIRNSFEAMSGIGSERRVLTLRTSQNQAGHAEIVVSDTGCGLDADHLDQIFDPFFTTKHDGMGLGLSISRSIVEEHMGRLWAKSASEGGATFVIELPLAQEEN